MLNVKYVFRNFYVLVNDLKRYLPRKMENKQKIFIFILLSWKRVIWREGLRYIPILIWIFFSTLITTDRLENANAFAFDYKN